MGFLEKNEKKEIFEKKNSPPVNGRGIDFLHTFLVRTGRQQDIAFNVENIIEDIDRERALESMGIANVIDAIAADYWGELVEVVCLVVDGVGERGSLAFELAALHHVLDVL